MCVGLYFTKELLAYTQSIFSKDNRDGDILCVKKRRKYICTKQAETTMYMTRVETHGFQKD